MASCTSLSGTSNAGFCTFVPRKLLKESENGMQTKHSFRQHRLPGLERASKGLVSQRGALSGSCRRRNSVCCAIEARGIPPIMPAVMTPMGVTDLSTLLLRNRIIFLGSPVNGQVAQKVISSLLMLSAIDEKEDIKMYINCPGGSIYSIMAIYDCMQLVKPDIATICFGLAASQGALLLAGGTKGKRSAMPNTRIMIHQPQGGSGGTMEDVRRQVNELMISKDKVNKMYAEFTGQPLEVIERYTDRDRFFSAAEALEFGLIDNLVETEY